MSPRRTSGFAWTEMLVALFILIVLLVLVVPQFVCFLPTHTLVRGQMIQTLSNMKQLHLATQQMALDGITTGNTNLGWPGDTGGTFTNWARHLVPEYLGTNDFRKLLSAPGRIVQTEGLPAMNEGALLVYAVSTNSPGNTLFLSTANFTNTATGGILDTNALPYRNKGLVIFHRDGTGAILRPKDATNRDIIGPYAPLCD